MNLNLRQFTLALVSLLLGFAVSGAALAQRGHSGGGHSGGGHFHGGHFSGGHFSGGHFHGGARFGVFVGAPLFWPWYYPYASPYYYYPPAVAVPPAYIEQGDEDYAPEQGPGYWYYCANPKGYYPYVKNCPGGWQQVPAQPPPGP
jgi:hypothetical protein